MPTDLPHYYSSLAPFVDTFRSGLPILTYHHVGPRPRGARLKGLYVSPQLFARQMRELAESGFITTGLPVGESAGESGHTVTAPKTIWLVRRRGEDTAPYPAGG